MSTLGLLARNRDPQETGILASPSRVHVRSTTTHKSGFDREWCTQLDNALFYHTDSYIDGSLCVHAADLDCDPRPPG